jgi:acetolactate synthase I/II/III large subunit
MSDRTATDGTCTVYEAIAWMIRKAGATRAFAVAGTNNYRITHALKQSGVQIIAARHEGNAASMAGAYARLSRTLGVLSVHAGPGLTNAITGIGEAAKSGFGTIVLAGDVDPAAKTSNSYMDQTALARSVGAVSIRLTSTEMALAEAAEAISLARDRAQTVVLSMPLPIQYARIPRVIPDPPLASAVPQATPGQLANIVELLSISERPLILGGRGAALSGAGPVLRNLAQKTGSLTATTLPAYGLFSGDPFDLGVCGGFSGAEMADVIGAADLILGFGASFTQWTTRHGKFFRAPVRIVQIDANADRLGLHRPVTLSIHADAGSAAHALNERLGKDWRPAAWRNSDMAARIAAARPRAVAYEDSSTNKFFDPRTLSRRINEILPKQRMLVFDAGHYLGWTARYIDVPDADAAFYGLAFQSIGLGLGAAIAAALARPEHLTILCTGDGGFMMSLADLETAVRLGIRLGIVIYDDAAYGAEVHPFGADGLDTSFVKFPDIDLSAPAKAFGARGAVARVPDDLRVFADWCANANGVFVLDAKIDPNLEADWHIDWTRRSNH